jgi:hypothetical protein
MKLSIDGRVLDLQAALERPTLLLVREMKIRTGYGMKSLMQAAESFKGKDGLEILDDPDLTGALIAMIWLARRSEGEQLTFDEAGSFDINALELVEEEPPLLPAAEIPAVLPLGSEQYPAPVLPAAGVEIPKAPATDSAAAAEQLPPAAPAAPAAPPAPAGPAVPLPVYGAPAPLA